MKKALLFPLLAITLPLHSPLLPGETVSLEPAKDNSMFQEAAESNGIGSYLFAGKTSTTNAGALRRALLQFNLQGVIPAGAVIESASLSLRMNKAFTDAPQTMTLHRLTRDWGEGASNAIGQEGKGTAAQAGDATWLYAFYQTTAWTTPGGDFAPGISASRDVGGAGVYTWSGTGMVADVQAWIDNPSANFGWILIGLESETSAKRFDSREALTAANRPTLTLTYSVAPPGWAGYPISQDGTTVDTGVWIGIIDIRHAPWIFSQDLATFLYAPEENIGDTGGWIWIHK